MSWFIDWVRVGGRLWEPPSEPPPVYPLRHPPADDTHRHTAGLPSCLLRRHGASSGGSGRFSSIPLVLLSSSAGYQHGPLGVLLQLLGWSVTVIMDEGEETARENNYIRHRLRGDGAGPGCDVTAHVNDREGGGLRGVITCRRTDQYAV